MSFYANYSNKEMEKEYNEFYRSLYVAGDMIRYGFRLRLLQRLQDLFETLVNEEDVSSIR